MQKLNLNFDSVRYYGSTAIIFLILSGMSSIGIADDILNSNVLLA
jgi:hypothetical protein